MTNLNTYLAEVEAREKAATPGKWYKPHLSDDATTCNCTYIFAESYFGSIADISIDNGKQISDVGNDSPPLHEAKANGIFISHARQDIPTLLRLVRVLMEDGDFPAGAYGARFQAAINAAISGGSK